MNFAAWAGVAAEAAAGVKAGDQAEVMAGVGAKVEEDRHNKSTYQPFTS
jgi:hypothetical protein